MCYNCMEADRLDIAARPKKQTHSEVTCDIFTLLNAATHLVKTKAVAQIIRYPTQPNSNGKCERFNPMRLLSSSSRCRRHVFESQSSLIDQGSRVLPVYCMSVWLLNSKPPLPLCPPFTTSCGTGRAAAVNLILFGSTYRFGNYSALLNGTPSWCPRAPGSTLRTT